MDADTFIAFRSTCRNLRNETSRDFSNRVLNQQWLLRKDSIAMLTRVAENPRFANKMHRLWLGTHDLNGFWQRDDRADQPEECWRAYLSLTRDQDSFNADGAASDSLFLAMSKLPSLRSIEIGEWCQPDEKPRVGWGGNRIAHLTGQDLCFHRFGNTPGSTSAPGQRGKWHTHHPYSEGTLAHQLWIVLFVLSRTQQAIKALAVHLFIEPDEMHGMVVSKLPDSILALGKDQTVYQGLQNAFCRLQSLRMTLDYTYLGESDGLNEHMMIWLCEFVKLMPCLDHLTLFFDGLDSDYNDAYCYYPLCRFAEDSSLPCLSRLELGNATLSAGVLQRFLKRHRVTLKHVKLDRVLVRYEFDDDPLALPDVPLHWPGIFGELADISLRTLRLACLYEEKDRILTFAPGMLSCEECCWVLSHYGETYRPTDCGHVVWYSAGGNVPSDVTLDWVNRRWSREITPEDLR
ncbi:hypothetical protein LTR85_011745 [Meristemomyces frigidus]|nr:hypothetical protein LTR85_011745 [Meristemomyces frigidus]